MRIQEFIQKGVRLLVGYTAIPEISFELIHFFRRTPNPVSVRYPIDVDTTGTEVIKSQPEVIYPIQKPLNL